MVPAFPFGRMFRITCSKLLLQFSTPFSRISRSCKSTWQMTPTRPLHVLPLVQRLDDVDCVLCCPGAASQDLSIVQMWGAQDWKKRVLAHVSVQRCPKYVGISRHLKTSQDISRHLKTSQDISRHLKTSQDISRHIKTSQDISRHLKTSQDISRHLKTSQDISRHLKTSQDISRHLKTSQDISRLKTWFGASLDGWCIMLCIL